MNKKLIKEYVEAVLSEEWYWGKDKEPEEKKKKEKGFFDRLKGMFTGKGKHDDIAEEWISDKTMYYDIDVTDELEKQVKGFVEKKYDLAMKRAKGNSEKAEKMIRKALDIKFEPQFKIIARNMSRLDDEEDDI